MQFSTTGISPESPCSGTPLINEYDSAIFPDWLRDSDDDCEDQYEFYGYDVENDSESDGEGVVPTVIDEQLNDDWLKLFGEDDSKFKGNDFEGFELDEMWVDHNTCMYIVTIINYYYYCCYSQSPPRLNLSRYPRRNRIGVVYIDEELSDEDHYLCKLIKINVIQLLDSKFN